MNDVLKLGIIACLQGFILSKPLQMKSTVILYLRLMGKEN